MFKQQLRQHVWPHYLNACARVVLRSRKPLVIGITGSAGKTTTLRMIAAVLEHPSATPFVGMVWSTQKNMNDDYGLPLAVLGYKKWQKTRNVITGAPFAALSFASGRTAYPNVLVLEFGTHAEGHLQRLAKLAPPDIAIVTTIAPAHLDRLATIQGVVLEKSAIVRAAPSSGLVILGQDHDYVADLARASVAPVIKVGGRGIELSKSITHAVCRHLKIPTHVVEAGLAEFRPPRGRLSRLDLPGMILLDDTYNANPGSMMLALDTLREIATGRRLAILGHMGELGSESALYHQQIGRYARDRADLVIGTGELAKNYAPDHWFGTSDSCAEHILALVRPGDCILVKGSHAAHMGRVVEKLRAISETPH